MADKVGPGGLVSLGTYLDPSLTKGDLMVGSIVGKPGSLPPIMSHITVDLQLFEQAVGSAEMLKVDKVRTGESLRLNIGTAATLGTVTSVRDIVAEMDLRKPVVVEQGVARGDKQEDSGALASNRLGPHKVARPRKVLFDSSFLIAVMEHPTTWREDIIEKLGSFEPVVIAPVYDELGSPRGREESRGEVCLPCEAARRQRRR